MRTFIAVEFPAALRGEIERSAAALRRAGVTGGFSRAENYHLTLSFLGEVPEERLARAQEAMDACAAPPIPLTVGALGRFRGREGDTLWRQIDAPETLYALQSRLSDELRSRGFTLERRPFKPHLTLARRSALPADVKWEELSKRLRPLTYTAESITLFRSDQIKGKRVYTPLYETKLAL